MNPFLDRRSFLTNAATATVLAPFALRAASPRRKRIALLGTEVREHSHAQHFIDRHALGYTWQGGWQKPQVDLVSLYIDQFPERDLARSTARRHNVPIYPTIAEALTLGTSRLAVDGVVIIAEHGKYERNEKDRLKAGLQN